MAPLHWAAESGSKESVQLLLDYGADLTDVNVFDKTPAMIAKDSNHFEILKIIEVGIKLCICNFLYSNRD